MEAGKYGDLRVEMRVHIQNAMRDTNTEKLLVRVSETVFQHFKMWCEGNVLDLPMRSIFILILILQDGAEGPVEVEEPSFNIPYSVAEQFLQFDLNTKEDLKKNISSTENESAESLWKCEGEKCDGLFRSRFLMEDHYMLIHNKYNHFRCFAKGCERIFTTKTAFQGHAKWRQHGKIYTVFKETKKSLKQCPHCGNFFSSSNKNAHVKICDKKPEEEATPVQEAPVKRAKDIQDKIDPRYVAKLIKSFGSLEQTTFVDKTTDLPINIPKLLKHLKYYESQFKFFKSESERHQKNYENLYNLLLEQADEEPSTQNANSAGETSLQDGPDDPDLITRIPEEAPLVKLHDNAETQKTTVLLHIPKLENVMKKQLLPNGQHFSTEMGNAIEIDSADNHINETEKAFTVQPEHMMNIDGCGVTEPVAKVSGQTNSIPISLKQDNDNQSGLYIMAIPDMEPVRAESGSKKQKGTRTIARKKQSGGQNPDKPVEIGVHPQKRRKTQSGREPKPPNRLINHI